ncbi:hypothetical protein NEOLEDRAFT_753704 [Neolentinus lepideus HHB14362 ss-1]|uniref:Uncharacterized protein n=1 Tax=Neolentinus lepideus HHB14362 ss-1 TaxID=1314782 RepID=A0A165PUL3_9AGAM|nr:hypothetical protein NEOLEDRAFT_753704 [Neolentinus lepideus HHB14362 ss-1]
MRRTRPGCPPEPEPLVLRGGVALVILTRPIEDSFDISWEMGGRSGMLRATQNDFVGNHPSSFVDYSRPVLFKRISSKHKEPATLWTDYSLGARIHDRTCDIRLEVRRRRCSRFPMGDLDREWRPSICATGIRLALLMICFGRICLCGTLPLALSLGALRPIAFARN